VLLVYRQYFPHIISWIIDLEGGCVTCTNLAREFCSKATRKTWIIEVFSEKYLIQSDSFLSLFYYFPLLCFSWHCTDFQKF